MIGVSRTCEVDRFQPRLVSNLVGDQQIECRGRHFVVLVGHNARARGHPAASVRVVRATVQRQVEFTEIVDDSGVAFQGLALT